MVASADILPSTDRYGSQRQHLPKFQSMPPILSPVQLAALLI